MKPPDTHLPFIAVREQHFLDHDPVAQMVPLGLQAHPIPMSLDLRIIVRAILEEYALPRDGDHGVAHWARVLENGLRLAGTTGANADVVRLFAVFHDSKRVSEVGDPDHGRFGAEFAAELRGRVFELSDHEFTLLHRACVGHTHERTHPDITIQTCWDADRLDLGRVGITPHPSRLGSPAARDPQTIAWANGRSSFGIVPDFVKGEWGIDLGCQNNPD